MYTRAIATLSLLAATLLSGCATYNESNARQHALFMQGNFNEATALCEESAKEYANSKDAVIYNLQLGAAARAANKLDISTNAFESAYKKIDYYSSQPEISLSDEGTAFLTNQAYMPYKGYNYDKIMLCAYQALNFAELKDYEKAAVEIKRFENIQSQINAKSSAQNAQLGAQMQNQNISDYTFENPQIAAQLKRIYGKDFSEIKAIKPNTNANPYAYFVAGIVHTAAGCDTYNANRAADFFRLAFEKSGFKSKALAGCLANAETRANSLFAGKNADAKKHTYIVYEAGCAPQRRQIRLNLPLFLIDENLPHVSVNFPYLSKENSYSENLNIVANSKKVNLEQIADFDEIIEDEFMQNLPYVILRTMLSAAAKSTGQYFAKKAAGDYGILVDIGGAIYQSTTNNADLRTWTNLPKKVYIAQIETPQNAVIEIENAPLRLNLTKNNIVFIRKTSANSKVYVRNMEF